MTMFHFQAYRGSLGAAATNVALSAVPDTIFTDRNGAFIYTEQWAINALFYHAASALRARSNLPKWNAISRHNIYGINRAATIPSPCNIQDLRREPLQLSLNEPLTWECTNNAGASEETRVYQWLIPPDWSMELPAHLQRMTVRFTGSVAGVANTWSGPGNITFPDQDLRGGVYSIVGCQLFDAGTPAYRFILPRQRPSQGRLLRPGSVGLEAINNIPLQMFNAGMGEWGRFHTFELPQLEILANATAASVQEGWLDLLYLGESELLLDGTF
jgi:hypothetical protein